MFKDLLDTTQWIPFLLIAGKTMKLSGARLFEAIIIAVVAGAVSMWMTSIVIKKDIEYIKENQKEMKMWYKEMQGDVSALSKYTYTHIHSNHEE